MISKRNKKEQIVACNKIMVIKRSREFNLSKKRMRIKMATTKFNLLIHIRIGVLALYS